MMYRSIKLFPALVVLTMAIPFAAMVISSKPLWGQAASGNITGTVTDTTGGRIPGASVTATQEGTGVTRTVLTNEVGIFVFPFLPAGKYTIAVELTGFKRNARRGIELNVDQTIRLDIELEPGEITEVVEVTAETPQLERDSPSLGQVIDNEYVARLPLNARNPYALGLLSGNTVPLVGLAALNHPANQPFVVAGNRYTTNEFLVDGVDNRTFNRDIAYHPPVDAVQEFKVKQSTYSAEFGRAGGSTVNLVTKSGTNELHGNFFDFVRNEKLDANNFFNNAAGIERPPFKRNQFGATVGGPLIVPELYDGRNRTFFFLSWESFRQRQAAFSGFANVPPLSFRRGDFSNFRDAQGNLIPIFDPATRRFEDGQLVVDQFPGNIIPQQRINPVMQRVLELLPEPNVGPPNAVARNFLRTAPRGLDEDNFLLRLDHHLPNGSSISVRGSIFNSFRDQPGLLPQPLSGHTEVSQPRNGMISWTQVLTHTFINEFRFGVNRFSNSAVGSSVGVQIPGLAKFPGPLQGLPRFSFTFSGERSGAAQFNAFGGAGSEIDIENSFQWTDNVTWTHNKHTLKFGADVRAFRQDFIGGSLFGEANLLGTFFFGSQVTSSPDFPNSGAPFASFLLGFPNLLGAEATLQPARVRQMFYGFYIQDDWKVTPRFTLNLGLRYDLYTQPVDDQDTGGFFNVATGTFALPGKDGFSRAIVDGDHNNFAPRIGFAYQLADRWVLRAGYGIFYAEQEKNTASHRLASSRLNSPNFVVPPFDQDRDLAPKVDVSTPIQLVPTDPELSAFTVKRPLSATIFAPDLENQASPYIQQYSLSLQRQLAPNWLLEVSYNGSKGTKLGSRVNLNQLPESSVLDGTNVQANRRFPNINGIVLVDGAFATSNHNQGNVKLEKRFSEGLGLLFNYTFSRTLEWGPPGVVGTFDQNGATSLPLDSFNVKATETGPSVLDITHRLVFSGVWELPFGPGKPFLNSIGGVAGKLLGGWQVNGILSRRTGFPTDIRFGPRVANFSTHNVPDRVPGVDLKVDNPSVDQFFNPAAFRPAPTATNAQGRRVQLFGNAQKRLARGPSSFNLDFAITKDFTGIPWLAGEEAGVQFRAEFFNLTNTPTFFLPRASSPELTWGSPVFGQLSKSTATGRQIQFALRFLF